MSWPALADETAAGARRGVPVWSAVALLAPLAAVVGVGAANGGFFATAFGWTGLAFAWVVIVAAVASAARWGPLDVTWSLAAVALCIFMFASAFWAGSAGDAVDQGLRALVYAAAVAGALLLLRRRDIELWLFGLAFGAAAVCFYSLATRLFPDHFGAFNADAGYRLFVPIGYWNALGIFAALGALLALGVAVLGRSVVLRVAAAVALVVLLPTLYYTYSRGSWAALFAGLLVALAYSPRRERLFVGLLALGMLPALGVWLASRPHALTDQSVSLSAATHAGHRVAIELALLGVAQAAAAVGYVLLAQRFEAPARVRRALTLAVVLALLAGLVGVFAAYGAPWTLAHRAYDDFTAPPTGGRDLNGRLFSLSNNGRTVLWRAAWNEFRAHPVAGGGAGSFQRWWYAHRTSGYQVQDAHNLYAQTLGELGIIGGVLLGLFLALPLAAAVRARRTPLAAAALGAYVAYLVHCIVDWDWQMPAVTLLGLFAAAAIVVAGRGQRVDSPAPLRTPARAAIAVLAGVAAVVAFVGLIGNLALARAEQALPNGQDRVVLAQAKKAHRWAPWSTQALRDLGEAKLVTGDRQGGLADLRQAAADDPGDWETWFDLAFETTGSERAQAVARVKALNPYGPELALLEHPPATKKTK